MNPSDKQDQFESKVILHDNCRDEPMRRVRVIAHSDPVSITDQSAGNITDVNKIVERFTRTGELPQGLGNTQEPQYGDVSHLQKPLEELIQDQKDAIDRLKAEATAQRAAIAEKATKERESMQQQITDLKNQLNAIPSEPTE